MVALNTSTHKFIIGASSNPGDNIPVDMRVAMERLLADMGFSAFQISNTAPSDKTVLWWHKDVKTAKRYSLASGNWVNLSPDQYSLHLMQKCVLAASSEATLANNDLFPFYDVSAAEVKRITTENLIQALGGLPAGLKISVVAAATRVGDGTITKLKEYGCTIATSGYEQPTLVSTGNHGAVFGLVWRPTNPTLAYFSFNIGQTWPMAIGSLSGVNRFTLIGFTL